MFDPRSQAFSPVASGEARILSYIGRADLTLEGLLRCAIRAQFLRAAIGSTFGQRLERGLALAETVHLLLLAAHPAANIGQFRAKVAALIGFSSPLSATVEALARAGLSLDAKRLRLPNPSRGRRGPGSPSARARALRGRGASPVRGRHPAR